MFFCITPPMLRYLPLAPNQLHGLLEHLNAVLHILRDSVKKFSISVSHASCSGVVRVFVENLLNRFFIFRYLKSNLGNTGRQPIYPAQGIWTNSLITVFKGVQTVCNRMLGRRVVNCGFEL